MTANPICDDPCATDDRDSREGHLRSHEVTISFSPITRDRMDVDTCKWCQTTLLVKPPRKMCILTYWVMTWPWRVNGAKLNLLSLRSRHGLSNAVCRLSLSLTRGQILKLTLQGQTVGICSEPAWRGEPDGVIFIFISLISKSCQWKTISVKNDNFQLEDLWSKDCWPQIKCDQKHYRGIKRALQCFSFEFFLPIILLEIIAIVCPKISIFSKFDLWWPLVT